MTPQPAPGITGPVLLVVAGGAVSQAAIARTAELAAGAPVTVVGVGTSEISRTDAVSTCSAYSLRPAAEARRPAGSAGRSREPGLAVGSGTSSSRASLATDSGGSSSRVSTESEQVRRTVALAMSVLENTGIVAVGHVVTSSPARAVARVARARGARVVILDQPGPSFGGQPAVGLMAELRRRMYGSGVVVLAETDRRGGWVSG